MPHAAAAAIAIPPRIGVEARLTFRLGPRLNQFARRAGADWSIRHGRLAFFARKFSQYLSRGGLCSRRRVDDLAGCSRANLFVGVDVSRGAVGQHPSAHRKGRIDIELLHTSFPGQG
jgi:hypothetical protein